MEVGLHSPPYMDGNGRIGRFLMNVMMAAGGYPWIVIPVEDRSRYMTALEHASVGADIVPFTDFLGELTRQGIAGDPPPRVPNKERLAALNELAAYDDEIGI